MTRPGRRDRPRRAGGALRPPGHVALARALSKLGLATRSEAIALVLAGRVRVNGRTQRDPGRLVVPERITVAIDEVAADPPPARTIALHKPRGVMTTRLDQASTGLLLCTTDTQLAAWLTAPDSAVEREYAVTVRGRVEIADAERLVAGVVVDGQRYQAAAVRVRKASARESHLMVVLTEGKNREVRRLCAAIGHEVTRLHRIRVGGVRLDSLPPGAWRVISEEMLAAAFPGYSGQRSRPPDRTPAARRPRNRGGSL